MDVGGMDFRCGRGLLAALCLGLLPGLAQAEAGLSADALLEADFEALTHQWVTGAGKRPQIAAATPAFVSVLDAADIRRHGWTTLGEALDALPGVHVTYDRQYQALGVNGFGRPGDYNARVLLLIDGIPLNDSLYDTAPVGHEFPLDLRLVRRIEFIPGPGAVLYGGNAMLGVVNVVTENGAGRTPRLDATAGSAGLSELAVSGGRRGESGDTWLLAASRGRRAGEDLYFGAYERPGADAWSRGMDGEERERLFARYSRAGLTATLLAGSRDKSTPGGPWSNDLSDPRSRQIDRRSLASLRYERPLDTDTTLNLNAYAGTYRYRATWVTAGEVQDESADNTWYGGEANLITTRLPDQTLTLGLALRNDVQRRQINPTLDVDTPRHSVGLFVQNDWAMSRAATLSAGLRFDRNSLGFRQTSPRLALLLKPHSDLVVKASVGSAYRFANAYESDYAYAGTNVANPSLGAERLLSREIGIDYSRDESFRLAARLYRNRLTHLVVLETDPATDIAQHRSAAPISVRGGAIEASGRAASWRYAGSVSWHDVSTEQGAPVANTPRWMAKLRVSMPLSSAVELAWETRYLGRRRAESGVLDMPGPEQGGFAVSHLSANGLIRPGLHWQLTIGNVFNRRYGHVVGAEFSAAYPASMSQPMWLMTQDGRSLMARVGFEF